MVWKSRGAACGVGALLLAGALGCPAPEAPKPAAEKAKSEADLSKTSVSAECYRSMRIRSEPVRVNQAAPDYLPLTGWVTPKPGREVTLTAPWPGRVRAVKGGPPAQGMAVRAGQEVWELDPALTAVELVQMDALKRTIDTDVAKARESADVAEKELRRLEDLARQGLRSQQDLEQARAKAVHAQEDYASARDRRVLLLGANGSDGRLGTFPVVAPHDGVVLTVPVTPGQYVAAAAPLATLADLGEVWVRVPVPEEYLARVAHGPATLLLNGRPDVRLEVKPVAAVPQVDPVRHTADLIYELDARSLNLSRDQMATVLVNLSARTDECLVPYDAVVYDAYGGAWVYVDLSKEGAEPHLFERRRVELGPSVGGDVVVRPPECFRAGERVVRDGAQLLFSSEFFKPPVK
jgi:RND family efflux transporter MFP subunit